MRKLVIFGIALAALFLISVIALREPRGDRLWDQEVAYVATAVFNEDGTITIKNVRDFVYGDQTVVSTEWIQETVINQEDIVRAWFVLEPFAEWEAVGHTLLTFELSDGSAYSFSVEARREKGESYSALKGLFNEYELTYSWGTERDFITRRVLYLAHPVHMYPLTLNTEQAQRLFIGLLEKTNNIARKPRFYNTLTANCTNVLAEMANEIKPGAIPWDVSWYLPGYSDRFLTRIGFIEQETSFEQTREEHNVSKNRASILDLAAKPHAEFGAALRKLLP